MAVEHVFTLRLDVLCADAADDYLLEHPEWGTLALPHHRPGQPLEVGRLGAWLPPEARAPRGVVVIRLRAVERTPGAPLRLERILMNDETEELGATPDHAAPNISTGDTRAHVGAAKGGANYA